MAIKYMYINSLTVFDPLQDICCMHLTPGGAPRVPLWVSVLDDRRRQGVLGLVVAVALLQHARLGLHEAQRVGRQGGCRLRQALFRQDRHRQ